jgi:hypothetical protein
VESGADSLTTGLAIFLLTFFLDLLELSYARILWFVRTLRFWLYFLLHFGLSSLAAYLLYGNISQWYLLAPVSTFLGVAVISNINIKIAGYSLVPISDLFVSIKGRMFEQAAEDKAREAAKAHLVERLQRLSVKKVEDACRAGLLGARQKPEKVKERMAAARKKAAGDDTFYKSILISELIKAAYDFAEKHVKDWEQSP